MCTQFLGTQLGLLIMGWTKKKSLAVWTWTSQTGMDKAAYELIIMKSSLWVSIREIYLITPVVYFDPNLQLNLTSICFSSTNEINYWNKDDTALQKAKKHFLNQNH